MVPKQNLSMEELISKIRKYRQKLREKIKNDPFLAAIVAKKEREKYKTKKKIKKQVKLVKDMSESELRAK